MLNSDYGDYGDDAVLSSRLLFRTLHGLHPDPKQVRMGEWVEDRMHRRVCETPFSVRSYEFEAGYGGGTWRQWICWCGEGTYVERVSNA